MSWWKKALRVIQINIEDRYSRYLTKLSGKDLIKMIKELNANVLVLFARDPWGRKFYSSNHYQHPKLKYDLIKEVINEAHKENIKVIVMVAHTANKKVFSEHSEWAQVNYKGEVILLEHAPKEGTYIPEWPQICINSPYFNMLKEEVNEAINLGADGIFLDSFRYQPDFERACYCVWCQRMFKDEKGYEMLREPNWSDSRWKELWDWRYEVVIRKIKELHNSVKSKDLNILFMYNSHPGGWAGRTNRIVELGRDYMDAVFAECSEADHQPPGFITEMVKLTKAMVGQKPVFASRNYFHMYRTTSSTTEVAIRQGLREAVVGGGSPWLLIFSSALNQDLAMLKAVKEVFSELKTIEDYLVEIEPVKYSAILVSNVTRDHYGRGRPQHYVDEVRGFYYALTHEHVPTEFIAERDVEDLRKLREFKVLILPNAACLSEKAVQTISEFVKYGGGVVATYLTSAYDAKCIENFEFSLSEVFGVNLISILKTPWSYIRLKSLTHPLLKGIRKSLILWGDMSYDFKLGRTTPNLGWHAVVEPIDKQEVLGNVFLATDEWGYEYTLGRSPPPAINETNLPSIIENSVGYGKSIYFTGQLGRHYWRVGLPEYLNLVINSVTYVGGEPSITVSAPSTIHVGYFMKKGKFIIHIINHTYNQKIQAIGMGGTKQPLPPYSSSEAVHPPREVIPVNNVSILVRLKKKTRAYSPLSGRDFEIRDEKGLSKVIVGQVKEYELVVIE